MSRTRRRSFIILDRNDKPPKGKYWSLEDDESGHCDYYSKRNSKYDHKAWMKSISSFKKEMKKMRKAKERQAMKNKDYENVPIFHNENDYIWN